MDALSLCATCAGSGFLVDKVPLFPFLLGLSAGTVLAAACPGSVDAVLRIYRRVQGGTSSISREEEPAGDESKKAF